MLIMRLPKIVIIITAICIKIHQPITAAITCSCATTPTTTRIPILIIQAIIVRMASTSSIATPIPITTLTITTLTITAATALITTATTCS